MLKIKLSRTGRRNLARYRVAVMEARSKVTGKTVADLGHYNPHDPKNTLQIDFKAYEHWISQGAQPTETVRKLIAKQKQK
jgi:small subunit ribosomal protein S16